MQGTTGGRRQAVRAGRCAAAACVALAIGWAPARALDLKHLSPTVGACTDFWTHVNGAWEADTPIPPDRSRIGSFDAVRDANRNVLRAALEEAASRPKTLDTPGKRLAATYFASGMNTEAIERRGLSSLAPLLAEIDALRDASALPRIVARLHRAGVGAPFALRVAPDSKDKRRYALHFAQAGLGLPDRDDYESDADVSRRLRAAYRAYAVQLLMHAEGGTEPDAAARAAARFDAVFALERRLAAASMTRVAMRDPNALYNPLAASALAKQAPGFDWNAYLRELGVGGAVAPVASSGAVAADASDAPGGRIVIVMQPAFARAVGDAAAQVPIAAWRTYLKLRLLDAAAPYLPRAYTDAHFAFHSRTVRGAQKPRPRADVIIDTLSGPFGQATLAEGLGEIFVARAFSPAAKARALAMVDDIRAALAARIERLSWMSDATKARALRKLDAMALKIGYPDRWKTYDGLRLERDDYVGNWLRANEWDVADQLARLDAPVDRTRWFTSPHTVNAFAGSLNEIIFPAGILQPPFFDANADDAVNYGGIGSVIGHEITHHFDDRGRQFDEYGNLVDWWTAADAAAYRERAARLARQYDGYEPLPGLRINGRQTLGENISDLGGVQIAYDGLQRALARGPAGASDARRDGYTPAQRFFLSYATIWRSRTRDEALTNQIRTGSHSPARFRVIGPLVNVPAFADAFGCTPGSGMVRAEGERVEIW